MIESGFARSILGKRRRWIQKTSQSIAAADATRSVVNVAASTSLGAKAKRHSSELAAKQTIAAAANIRIRGGIPAVRPATDP
jgi:hypothetical protein